eukprot:TRINITY_DN78970_c0_g1_i1.p1 TRINITY_DN78970_c0_g1~~TRINITY_DN78970_c0_g1_i1.p1  ORF type:complete len:361 (+),score=32.16 TRINITY_DN78970_c0_g1_i1:105-1187(+)
MPSMPEMSKAQLWSIVKVCSIGGAYMFISGMLINFNKFLMHAGRFPHAVHLTAIHMTVTFLLTLGLYVVAPSLFPTMCVAKEKKWLVAKYIAPLGMLFAVSLFCSNQAYVFCSVSFLQFCKEGNVALVFAMSCALGLQRFSWNKVCVLAVVICGCSLCATGELHFVMLGFILQILSQFAECSKNIIGEMVMGKESGLKLDVLTFVLFQAPFSLLPLLVACFCLHTPEVGYDFIKSWPLLLANACIAFLLNLVIALCLKELSTVAYVVIGIAKDVVIVVSSSMFFGNVITPPQRIGFGITIFGLMLWSQLKIREADELAAQLLKQTAEITSDCESANESSGDPRIRAKGESNQKSNYGSLA